MRLDAPSGDPGETPAILYLHGFGSSQSGEKASFFRARAREEEWAFCSLDFRGHGLSGGSMRDLSLSRNLDDVGAAHALLAGLGYRNIFLFGSSMGGATALWYAARHPEELRAAAHIAPAVGLLRGLELWAGEEGMARWMRDGAIRFRNDLVECDLGWKLVEDLRSYSIGDLVESYRTPTILFQGQRDATVDWRDVAAFAERCDGKWVRLELFAEGDHRLIDRLPALWSSARRHFAAHLGVS